MSLEDIFPIPEALLPKSSSIFLNGIDGCCKTSLLFQLSHTLINQYQDKIIIYLCNETLNKLPLSVDLMPNSLDNSLAKKIIIIYLPTLEDLIDYLAKFFTLKLNPIAFIANDINLFMKNRKSGLYNGESYTVVLARVFSLLVDTVEYIKYSYDQPCKLLVAYTFEKDSFEEPIKINRLGQMYFDQIWTIQKLNTLASLNSLFEMTEKEVGYKISYFVKDGKIFLEKVFKKKK